MSSYSNYGELSLSREITRLSNELLGLKTKQFYGTQQIVSPETYTISVPSYVVNVPPIMGSPAGQIREVAATFTFVGEYPTKTAIAVYHFWSSIDSQKNAPVWQAFMPSSGRNEIKLGCVWRMYDGGNLNVSLSANMRGKFTLDRTYTVYLS